MPRKSTIPKCTKCKDSTRVRRSASVTVNNETRVVYVCDRCNSRMQKTETQETVTG
jgi:hypothetical protein